MADDRLNSTDIDIADIKARVKEIERRCGIKDTAIKALEAWQNRALGYLMALSTIAAYVANQIWK